MSETPLYQCRLCLTNSQLYYSLFDKDVNVIIESFAPIKIEANDALPTSCCPKCLEEIYLIHKIRCRIIESDRILRDQQTEHATIKSELNEAFEQSQSTMKTDNNDQQPKILLTTCTICLAQIKVKNYQRHMLLHNSTQQICELCGAVAKNSESLRGHMFYMHKCTAEEYKCDQCGRFYRYKYKFLLHMRKAHGGERTHICEICGKSFYTARDVNRHIQMKHLKLRPYKCQYCNKNFCSTSSLRTHIRQHTNEKPYKCDVCAESFRQKVSLKTHLKSKHDVILNTKENNSIQ